MWSRETKWLLELFLAANEQGEPTATLNMVFSVSYYLELHDVIFIYCRSHILPANVKLVVWIL